MIDRDTLPRTEIRENCKNAEPCQEAASAVIDLDSDESADNVAKEGVSEGSGEARDEDHALAVVLNALRGEVGISRARLLLEQHNWRVDAALQAARGSVQVNAAAAGEVATIAVPVNGTKRAESDVDFDSACSKRLKSKQGKQTSLSHFLMRRGAVSTAIEDLQ